MKLQELNHHSTKNRKQIDLKDIASKVKSVSLKGSFADIMKNMQIANQEKLEEVGSPFPILAMTMEPIETKENAGQLKEIEDEVNEKNNLIDESLDKASEEDELKKTKIKKNLSGEELLHPIIKEQLNIKIENLNHEPKIVVKKEENKINLDVDRKESDPRKANENLVAKNNEYLIAKKEKHVEESTKEIIKKVLIDKKKANEENKISSAEKKEEIIEVKSIAKKEEHIERVQAKNEKPIQVEHVQKADKTFAVVPKAENIAEVFHLDKNKWDIRKEKEIEYSRMERNVRLQSNIVQQSSQSGNLTGDSEKRSDERKMNIIDAVTKQFKKQSEARVFKDTPAKNNLNELVKAAKVNIVANGKSTASITMNPKELGKLTLNVSVQNEKVEGKILVESEIVKQQILGDINNLRNELKNAGLELADLQIEVREDTSYLSFGDSNKQKERNAKESLFMSSQNEEYTENIIEPSVLNHSNNLVDIKI